MRQGSRGGAVQHSAVRCGAVQAVGVGAALAQSQAERCRWASGEVQAQRCRVPRVAGRKWTVGAGWTCNEQATMLYALYVRARMYQMLWDAMLCSGPALPCSAVRCEREAT